MHDCELLSEPQTVGVARSVRIAHDNANFFGGLIQAEQWEICSRFRANWEDEQTAFVVASLADRVSDAFRSTFGGRISGKAARQCEPESWKASAGLSSGEEGRGLEVDVGGYCCCCYYCDIATKQTKRQANRRRLRQEEREREGESEQSILLVPAVSAVHFA